MVKAPIILSPSPSLIIALSRSSEDGDDDAELLIATSAGGGNTSSDSADTKHNNNNNSSNNCCSKTIEQSTQTDENGSDYEYAMTDRSCSQESINSLPDTIKNGDDNDDDEPTPFADESNRELSPPMNGDVPEEFDEDDCEYEVGNGMTEGECVECEQIDRNDDNCDSYVHSNACEGEVEDSSNYIVSESVSAIASDVPTSGCSVLASYIPSAPSPINQLAAPAMLVGNLQTISPIPPLATPSQIHHCPAHSPHPQTLALTPHHHHIIPVQIISIPQPHGGSNATAPITCTAWPMFEAPMYVDSNGEHRPFCPAHPHGPPAREQRLLMQLDSGVAGGGNGGVGIGASQMPFQVPNKRKLFRGPSAVQMVSQNRPPPMQVPVQVPQGQVMQPYLNENGILTHVLLSTNYPQVHGGQGGVPHTHAPFITTNGTQSHYYSPLAAGYPPGPGGTPHYHPMGGGHIQPHQPMSHSPSPPSNYHKDDRSQRQHTKIMRKIDPKRDMTDSALSTPAHSPSPRKNDLNGLRRTSRNGASSVGTSEDGEESSSVPDDDEDCQAIIDQLSGIQRPDVRDITSRSAMLRWEAPPISEIINIRDLRYDVLLSDRAKEGKYKIIFKGESYVCMIQDLRPAQEYLVRLQVHYEKLQGSPSEATVFTTPACEPDQPIPPKLINCTKNSLQLRWAAPNCNGSPVIQYILEYDEGKGTTFVEAVKTKARQYTISKLQPSTLYSFRLSAVNEYGPSMYSNVITFATAGNPPSTPRPPILQATTPNTLRLAWERRTHDEEFILQMADRDSGRGFFTMYSGLDTIYECRGLRRATAYQFRLRADNEVGSSSWSNEVVYKTQPERPGKPGKPQIKGPIQADYFRAKWDPPNDRGGAEIRKYHLEISSGTKFERIYSGIEQEAICDRLSPGTNYQIRVSCEGPGGQSAYSEVCAVTTDAIVPGTPEPPFCSSPPGTNAAELMWKRPAYNGGSPIVEYQVQLNGPQRHNEVVYYGNETCFLVEDLQPSEEYEANVRAVNRVGAGAWSKPLKFTSAIAPPNAPEALIIDIRSPTHLTVSWKEPHCNGGQIIEYRLEISSTNESSDSFNIIYQGIQTSTDIRNLVPYTIYYFRVNASNLAGSSQYSSIVTTQTPAAVPAAPQLLKSEYTATEVTLTWSEPNCNGADILYYNIEFADQSITTDDNCTEYKITNLASETSYKFKIQAVNEVGASQFSNVLKLTTLPPPPQPPALECCGAGPNFIKLKWGDGKNVDTNKFKLEKYKNRTKKFVPVYNGRCHTFTEKKLREQTSYIYRISAYNDRAGMSEYSKEYVFTTSANLPGDVKNLRAIAYATSASSSGTVSGSLNLTTGTAALGGTSATGVLVSIEWEPSKSTFSDPIEYILEYSLGEGAGCYNKIYRGPDTKHTIDSLQAGAICQFRVCPVRVSSIHGDVVGNFCDALTYEIVPQRLLAGPTIQKPHHNTPNHHPTVSASTNQRSVSSNSAASASVAGLCAIDSAVAAVHPRDDRIKSNSLCNNANVGAIKRFTGKLTVLYSNRKRFTDKEKAIIWMFSFILLTICFAALVRMFMS